MMKNGVTLLLFAFWCLVMSGPGRAEPRDLTDADIRERPHSLNPKLHRIGGRIADLQFTDVDGQQGKLSDFAEHDALVIAFHSVDCPLSGKLLPSFLRLAESYQAKNVAFLIVNPMENDTEEKIQKCREKTGLRLRYARDLDRRFQATLRAFSTTDVFVLDKARTLTYRGAIHDQYGLGYALDAPRNNYMADALEAILGARRPQVEATSSPGCALADVPALQPRKADTVTYHDRVSRILQRNCQECHRPGEAAPFPLMGYDDAKGNRAMIRRVVERGTMPPWFAKGDNHRWSNDRRLSPAEKSDLLAWIENGTPEGDPGDAPASIAWTQGWTLGEPDLVLKLPLSMEVPAEGTVPYRYVQLRNRFKEDKWVSAMEIRPTARENVHHVLVFLEYPEDHPRAADQPNYRGGQNGFFAGMVPGQTVTRFEPGVAKFIPKGATLQFQLHYTTNGERTRDRTRIGLYFADEPPRHEVRTRGVSNPRLLIPPHAPNHEAKAKFRFPEDGRILAFLPHMHVRGKAFRYELFYPDGASEVVLDVPAYDFNWQLVYELREPIAVPAGTVVQATGWFDNSEGNPANPDPNVAVRFGEQTWEEMLIGYMNWYPLPAHGETADKGSD